MSKYEIVLSSDEEKVLLKIATEQKTTKESVLNGLMHLFLCPAHSMEEEELRLAYNECAKLYISWSETGTD